MSRLMLVFDNDNDNGNNDNDNDIKNRTDRLVVD